MTINRASIILWIVLFTVGMGLAMHKPLWNDELCSQRISIEGASWKEILTGRIRELNNPPLYYALQKAVTSVINLHFPDDLNQDLPLPVEQKKYFLCVFPKGQIILRLMPDIFMVTAMVFLVRFFWVRSGVAAGLMALLSTLSSGLVWQYWAEARPYSLWFLLTLLQAIFLIQILTAPASSKGFKFRLIICHYLLVLTMTLGLYQVIIAQVILFIFGQRQLKFHFGAGFLPICLALFFLHIRSSGNPDAHRMLYFSMNPVAIIKSNFSFEQASLLVFYLASFFCRQVWFSRNDVNGPKTGDAMAHLPNFLTGLLLSIAFIIYVYWRWPGEHGGVPVHNRHFFFLSALSVVLVPAMFSDLWSRSKGLPYWRGVFLVFFIVLLFSQFLEGFANAWFQGYYY